MAASTLQGFQISDHIRNLARVEAELGHGGMPRDDPFCERLRKLLHRVSLVEIAKGWRDRRRACSGPAGRVTLTAVSLQKNPPPLGTRVLSRCCDRDKRQDAREEN